MPGSGRTWVVLRVFLSLCSHVHSGDKGWMLGSISHLHGRRTWRFWFGGYGAAWLKNNVSLSSKINAWLVVGRWKSVWTVVPWGWEDGCKFLFNVTKLDAQRAKPHQKSFSVLFEWLKEDILLQLQCEYLPSPMSGTKKSFPFLLPLGFSQLD